MVCSILKDIVYLLSFLVSGSSFLGNIKRVILLSIGNSDTLGTELLESLLKMAPTKDEECRLKEFQDDESPFKLGPAEKFLKVVLDIPFAFKRVDAMLYITNFDSELEYLKKSFETLEVYTFFSHFCLSLNLIHFICLNVLGYHEPD